MTKSIIHIGGNKTASTLMQKHLFSEHSDISYVGEEGSDPSFRDHIDCLIHQDEFHYRNHRAEDFFADWHKNNTAKIRMFSSEDIMGCQHPSVVARRLKKIYGDEVQVIIVVRNQLTAINTWYFNHGAMLKPAPSNYWRRFVDWQNWIENCFRDPSQSTLWALNYNAYFEIFAHEFGEQNIRVLMYEDLQHHPESYFADWAKILGIPENDVFKAVAGKRERMSRTPLAYKIHSIVKNHDLAQIIYGGLRVFERRTGVPNFLNPQDRSRISEYFRLGNENLREKTGLDLKKYGYPLPFTAAKK